MTEHAHHCLNPSPPAPATLNRNPRPCSPRNLSHAVRVCTEGQQWERNIYARLPPSRGGLPGLAGVTTRPAGYPSGGIPPCREAVQRRKSCEP